MREYFQRINASTRNAFYQVQGILSVYRDSGSINPFQRRSSNFRCIVWWFTEHVYLILFLSSHFAAGLSPEKDDYGKYSSYRVFSLVRWTITRTKPIKIWLYIVIFLNFGSGLSSIRADFERKTLRVRDCSEISVVRYPIIWGAKLVLSVSTWMDSQRFWDLYITGSCEKCGTRIPTRTCEKKLKYDLFSLLNPLRLSL